MICGDLEVVVKTNDFHVVRMIPVPIALAALDIEVELAAAVILIFFPN